jgi:hypothetical protein
MWGRIKWYSHDWNRYTYWDFLEEISGMQICNFHCLSTHLSILYTRLKCLVFISLLFLRNSVQAFSKINRYQYCHYFLISGRFGKF